MERFTTSDGVSLAYDVRGEGAPLLLLNGMFGDLPFWQPVTDVLQAERRCVLLDHRGVGASDHWVGTYSFGLWARDALELLDHLGLSAVPVLGLCHGGMVGATMALRHRDRITGLVAHGTRLLPSAKTRVFDGFRRRLLDLGGVGLMMGTQMGLVFGEAALEEIEPHLGKMEANSQFRISPEAAGPMLDALIAFGLEPSELAEIDLPALFLAGEEDLYVPPWMCQRTANAWPGAGFEVIPGVGHIVPREAPRELAERTLRFLDEWSL